MRQIDKEFTELLLTKTQGKMIDKLAVREYDMGESLPVFSDLHITKCEKSEDGHNSKIEVSIVLVPMILSAIVSFSLGPSFTIILFTCTCMYNYIYIHLFLGQRCTLYFQF